MKINRFMGFVLALATLAGSNVLAAVTYYHNDLLGSAIAATDESRAIVWKESYRPYGERIVKDESSADNDIWYASRRQDPTSGIIYLGARHFDPVSGRFLSKDGAEFDENNIHSFNRYSYARNNPYSYVDPDGNVGIFVPVVVAAIRFIGQRVLTFALTRGAQASIAAAEIGAGEALGAGTIAGVAAAEKVVASRAGDVAREIPLSLSVHGDAAQHAGDAIRAGQPSVLTIARPGAPANRQASTGALDKVPNKHLDEYPPAMFKEGGSGASVRAINPRDNMSAGACIGNACRGLPDGTRVRITVGE
ncbi:MAG: RHS repeat-associated core domain-containing protein [Usitatibacter sp.]